MIVYFFNIVFSIFFINTSFIFKKNNKKFFQYIFLMIGLLMPCVIAGLRNINVGFDTHFYVLGLFDRVKYFNNPIEYIKAMSVFWQINDVAYLILTYVVAKIFNNFNVLLFFIELLIVAPFYFSIKNYSDNKKIVSISFFMFYLFWYNATFNMARQSIAIAFSLLSISFINKDNLKKALFYNFIALLFHKTALLTLFINIIYYLFEKNKNDKNKIEKLSRTVIFISFAILIFIIMLTICVNSNISIINNITNNIHYFTYLKNVNYDFSFIDTYMYVYVYLVLNFNKNILLKSNINYFFFKTLSLSSIILLQIGALIPYGERISFYLIYPLIINILPISISESKTKKSFYIQKLTFVTFIMYWFLVFYYLGIHDTIPYKFYF